MRCGPCAILSQKSQKCLPGQKTPRLPLHPGNLGQFGGREILGCSTTRSFATVVVIRDNFWSLDVERILQIPLSQQNFEDNVAWHYTKTGVFSVRSAYYCEWDDQCGSKLGQEGGQSSSMNHPVWKQVWKLKMPGKVKIFIWRCLHNAIPFRSTLANRHIPVSGECPVCHAGAEDSKHALFGCK